MEKREILNHLFSWNHELPIIDQSGNEVIKVYQRLVGDADLDKARKTALRYARIARQNIQNKDSDEYFIYIDSLNDLNKDQLVATILFDQIFEIRKEIEDDFDFPEPDEPDDNAAQEAFEEYQELFDTYESRRREALNLKIAEEMDKRANDYREEDIEELKKVARDYRVRSHADEVLRTKFAEMCCYLGTYSDDKYKNRLYKSFEEFVNEPEFLKNQLSNGYLSLEVSSINLKGLEKASNSETS